MWWCTSVISVNKEAEVGCLQTSLCYTVSLRALWLWSKILSQTTREQNRYESMLGQAAMSRSDLWVHLSILIFFPKEKVLRGCETLKSLPSLENQAPFVKSPHPHRHVTGKKTGWEVLRSSPSYLLSTPGKLLRISESYTKGCFRVLWFQPA